MKQSTIGVAVAIVIVLVFVALLLMALKENFATKREKAAAVSDWYKSGGRSYKSYRAKIPSADIVEYTDVKKILTAGDATVDKLSNAVAI